MRLLILLALVGFLTPSASLRESIPPSSDPTVELTPASPTSDDSLTLKTAISLSTPCWALKKANLRVEHLKRKVRVDLRYGEVFPLCTSSVVCDEHDVSVPRLSAGEWQFKVRWFRNGKKVWQEEFDVTVSSP